MKKTLTLLIAFAASIIGYAQTQTVDVLNVNPVEGNGIRFWNNDAYRIYMGNSANYQYGPVTDYSIKMSMNNSHARGWTWGVNGMQPVAALNTQGNFQIAGDFVNLGNISTSGNITASGNLTLTGTISALDGTLQFDANGIIANSYASAAQEGEGFKLWNSDVYKIHMGNSAEYHYGPVIGYSIKTNMANLSGRGWVWGSSGSAPVAALDIGGNMQIKGDFVAEGTINASNVLINGNPINTSSTAGLWVQSGQDLHYDSGNVGIGTTNPDFKLHINSSANQLLRLTSTYGTWLDFESANASAGSRIWSIGHVGTPNKFGIYQRDGTDQYRFIIDMNGNVGIGTTNPDSKLTVDGKVTAEEIKVEVVNGPDYVFEDDYDLKTLEETAAYIEENNHLPDIPSAAEMASQGVDLGEMNMKLLQKIEELTLHVIHMNEEIQQLKQENEELKEKVK